MSTLKRSTEVFIFVQRFRKVPFWMINLSGLAWTEDLNRVDGDGQFMRL